MKSRRIFCSGLKAILRARLIAYSAGRDVAFVGYPLDKPCDECKRMGIECAECVSKKGDYLDASGKG